MGQYYMAVIVRKSDMRPVAYLRPTQVPFAIEVDKDNGTMKPMSEMTNTLKMREHAYIDRTITLVVEGYLSPDGPYGDGNYGLVWAGDYGPATAPGGKCWQEYVLDLLEPEVEDKPVMLSWKMAFNFHAVKHGSKLQQKSWRYIVNHTKKTYVDKALLYEEENGSVIHPMCILTAHGNGNGGGDYYGFNKNAASLWALDAISVCNQIPSGYVLTTDWSFDNPGARRVFSESQWKQYDGPKKTEAQLFQEFLDEARSEYFEFMQEELCKYRELLRQEFEDNSKKAEAAGFSHVNKYMKSIGELEYGEEFFDDEFTGEHACDPDCEYRCNNNGVNPGW